MKNERPKLSAVEAEMSNDIYRVAIKFETLEHAGLFSRNGHHAAQEAVRAAIIILRRNWHDRKEAKEMEDRFPVS